MNRTKKPPFTPKAMRGPIIGACISVFGLLSPFLNFSNALQIPVDNSRQLCAIIGGLLALVSIVYLIVQTRSKQINREWWVSFLIAIIVLLTAGYLHVAGPYGYQKEYRFRDRERIDALTDQLDGWDYEGSDTRPVGEILYLDDWSTDKPEQGNAESKKQWRYRIKQTTQSSVQPVGDWTVDPDIPPILNAGEWVDDPLELSGQNIESANQYRYRKITTKIEAVRDTWGWTTDTPMEVKRRYGSSADIVWQEREVLWYYYQFYCHGCGRSQKYYDTCIKCRTTNDVEYYERWEKTDYDELDARYGWVELNKNGDIYFASIDPSDGMYREPKKEYQYIVVENVPVTDYGEWSAWSFEDPSYLGDEVDIESRTVFRVSETIYTYYRWGEWSAWGSSEITPSDNTEVDYRLLYRPYVEATETVCHFSRWTDWSEWSFQEPEEEEGREIVFRWVKIPEDQEN